MSVIYELLTRKQRSVEKQHRRERSRSWRNRCANFYCKKSD